MILADVEFDLGKLRLFSQFPFVRSARVQYLLGNIHTCSLSSHNALGRPYCLLMKPFINPMGYIHIYLVIVEAFFGLFHPTSVVKIRFSLVEAGFLFVRL